MLKAQALVVESQQVEDGRVEMVKRVHILDGFPAKVIGNASG